MLERETHERCRVFACHFLHARQVFSFAREQVIGRERLHGFRRIGELHRVTLARAEVDEDLVIVGSPFRHPPEAPAFVLTPRAGRQRFESARSGGGKFSGGNERLKFRVHEEEK